jgi:hypothetical protein
MRPFVWGAMLLLTVVAFALSPAVVRVDRPPPEPVEPVAAEAGGHGEVWVMTTPARGKAVAAQVARKVRPARGEDLQKVLFEWTVEGEFRGGAKEAWESAIDAARNQVTHDLRLTVPPGREVIREKLFRNAREECKKNVIDGTDAVRIELDLQLTRGTYLELAEAERVARVTNRMEGTARGLGILVAALAAVAGYIRLDELTKGYYSGRLRALAVVLVAVAAWAIARA